MAFCLGLFHFRSGTSLAGLVGCFQFYIEVREKLTQYGYTYVCMYLARRDVYLTHDDATCFCGHM
jgi:hypothetical protein